MEKTIQTRRLTLRKFSAEDAEPLFPFFADDKTNTFLPWFPARTVAGARALVRRFIEEDAGGIAVHRAICLAGEPIGYIHADCGESRDLGYALRRDLWGRGFATEAGQAFLEMLRRGGFPYVTATHDVNNPASGAVMKKLGFSYRYSYREQWQPKNISVVFRMFSSISTEARKRTAGIGTNFPSIGRRKSTDNPAQKSGKRSGRRLLPPPALQCMQ